MMSVNYHLNRDSFPDIRCEERTAKEVPSPYAVLRIGQVTIFPTAQQLIAIAAAIETYLNRPSAVVIGPPTHEPISLGTNEADIPF